MEIVIFAYSVGQGFFSLFDSFSPHDIIKKFKNELILYAKRTKNQ